MRFGSISRSVVVVAAGVTLLAGCGGKDNSATTPQAAPASADPAALTSAAPTSAAPTSAAPTDNGVAALKATAILDRAKAALKSAKSFRMKGSGIEDGKKTTLDFEVAGTNVFGSVTMGTTKIQVLKAGGHQYMKPNAAFWKLNAGKQGAAVAQLVGDRWVKVSSSDKDFASMFALADVDTALKPDGSLSKGPAKVIAGTPAIGLIDHAKDGGTLYVATVGRPYPLENVGRSASDGNVTFSEFGATFTDVKAPAAADVVDLAALGG